MIDKPKIPIAPCAPLWLLATGLLVMLVLGTELLWRMHGNIPRVIDSNVHWSIHRDRVYGDKKVVIVGASRAQHGIDPDILQKAFSGYDVIQLASVGQPGDYTLQDLAHDQDFTGIILFSTIAKHFALSNRQQQKSRVDYYRQRFFLLKNLQQRIDTHIRVYLQDHLAILAPDLIASNLLRNIFWRGSLPNTWYNRMRANRFRAYHYLEMSPERLKRVREQREAKLDSNPKPASKKQRRLFKENVQEDLRHLYLHLRERGARLLLIRMPSSGKSWKTENITFPKRKFWDKITGWSGVPAIHFKDYPELADFTCPDTSHLDATDTPEFTRRLARIIRKTLKE